MRVGREGERGERRWGGGGGGVGVIFWFLVFEEGCVSEAAEEGMMVVGGRILVGEGK